MVRYNSPGILPLLFIALSILHADTVTAQKGKGGPALVWNHEIQVTPVTMKYHDGTVEGWSFAVYETDAKKLTNLWRADHALISQSISKGDPMRANGVRLPGSDAGPVTVLASVKKEKKSDHAVMSVALIGSDSVVMPADIQRKHARELAVKYNQAVVEAQIKAQERLAEKEGGRLSKSTSTGVKQDKSLKKTRAAIDKIRAQRLKLSSRNAQLKGEVVGAERNFTLTNDVKDLKKLTKARNKLSSGEGRVAKLMEKEHKLEMSAEKMQRNITTSTHSTEEHQTTLAGQQKTLDALRLKLKAIK